MEWAGNVARVEGMRIYTKFWLKTSRK